MTSRKTAEEYATRHHAVLSVTEDAEHWFRTPEQLAALAAWEKTYG